MDSSRDSASAGAPRSTSGASNSSPLTAGRGAAAVQPPGAVVSAERSTINLSPTGNTAPSTSALRSNLTPEWETALNQVIAAQLDPPIDQEAVNSIEATIELVQSLYQLGMEDAQAITQTLNALFERPQLSLPPGLAGRLQRTLGNARMAPGVPRWEVDLQGAAGLQQQRAGPPRPSAGVRSRPSFQTRSVPPAPPLQRRNAVAGTDPTTIPPQAQGARERAIAQEELEAYQLRRSRASRRLFEVRRQERLWMTDEQVQRREERAQDEAEMREYEGWQRMYVSERGEEMLERLGMEVDGEEGVDIRWVPRWDVG